MVRRVEDERKRRERAKARREGRSIDRAVSFCETLYFGLHVRWLFCVLASLLVEAWTQKHEAVTCSDRRVACPALFADTTLLHIHSTQQAKREVDKDDGSLTIGLAGVARYLDLELKLECLLLASEDEYFNAWRNDAEQIEQEVAERPSLMDLQVSLGRFVCCCLSLLVMLRCVQKCQSVAMYAWSKDQTFAKSSLALVASSHRHKE
jgi:hypothetical protein